MKWQQAGALCAPSDVRLSNQVMHFFLLLVPMRYMSSPAAMKSLSA